VSEVFEPFRANLGQQVFQHLLAKIYKMEITPGSALGVGEIAEQLGVSRSPVRDALLMLVAEGIVEPLPTNGYRVIQFDRKYIEDIFVFRRALELTAVRLCVQNMDRARVEQLKAIWLNFKHADVDDPTFVERHLIADNDFHQILADMSGNILLKEAINRTISMAQLIRRWQYAVVTPERQLFFGFTNDEHLQVIEAILTKDEDAAVRLLDEHLSRAYERSLARLALQAPEKQKTVRRKRPNRTSTNKIP
jgi:DNA-binding GntR family transcriptional regulator